MPVVFDHDPFLEARFELPPIDPALYGFQNYYDDGEDEDEDDETLPPAADFLFEGEDPALNERKRRAPELTRDQKVRIRCLYYDAQFTQAKIFEWRNNFNPPMPTITPRQIQKACDLRLHLTPRKVQGAAPPKVTDEMKEKIKAFIEEKPENRLIPWIELPYWIEGFDNVRDSAIKRAMEDLGYLRKERQKKICYSQKHKENRLKWAKDHEHLTPEQWAYFIFSDETWVTGTSPYRQWLTLSETDNPNDFAELRERPQGQIHIYGDI